MKKILHVICIISIAILLIWFCYGEKLQEIKNLDLGKNNSSLKSSQHVKADVNFGRIPLYFIANQGQVNARAKFYAKTSRYTLWLTKEGLVFDSTKKTGVRRQKSGDKGHSREARGIRKHEKLEKLKLSTQNSKLKTKFNRDVSRLNFIGANKNPEIIPLNQTKLKINYFKGNDPSKWVGNIPTSQVVLYKNLYKKIDLKVYGLEKQIEYDWIIKPGGNPEDIKFVYKNVKSTKIYKVGNLAIKTKFGELLHKSPVSYQRVGVGADLRVCPSDNTKEKRIQIKASFKKISKNTFGFKVGAYDKNHDLIIDPVVLAYSTYLGGSNIDRVTGIAVDNNGYAYVTGFTYSTDFPTLNQYQADQGDIDVFVTKLDTTQAGASSLLYSTYLGGGNADEGNGIAAYSSGYVYVAGVTNSTDFPTLNQYQADQGGGDVFVTKLDTTKAGVSSLLYSTYLGKGGIDEGWGIAIDSSGFAYVTGFTDSLDFPTLNQYQTYQGGGDVFITKLDTTQSGNNSLLYSTYLGGNSWEDSSGIAVDSSGYVYLTGYTESGDFPTVNPYQSGHLGGTYDVFVTKLDTTQEGASSLLYSTYLGGSNTEYGYDIAADNNGYAYVTGLASSSFPILNPYQGTPTANSSAFVTKLDTTQSGNGSLLYSTYLGGDEGEDGTGIAVDSSGHVYVAGSTDSTDFPILNQYQADQGNGDAFVTKLDTTQSGNDSLLYSTYLGGVTDDNGYGIAVDGSGHVYVSGTTDSIDFPCLAEFQTYQGSADTFVARLIHHSQPQSPIVLTGRVSSLKAISASGGGRVISEGDTGVIARGVCWSTSPQPTLFDDYTLDGSGTGDYSSLLAPLTPETTYYVRAYAANNDSIDYGDDIQFTTSPPSITVNSPNGGETYLIGATENITWTPDLLPGELLKIALYKPNGTPLKLIADNIYASLGTHAITIPTSVPEGDYWIKIKVKGKAISDKSDGIFTVSSSPSVTITSPNGGENWQIGTTENITWNASLLPGDLVKIVLLKTNGTAILKIADNVDPTLGSFAWDIPSGLPARDYLIKIKVKGKAISDISDSAFSVY